MGALAGPSHRHQNTSPAALLKMPICHWNTIGTSAVQDSTNRRLATEVMGKTPKLTLCSDRASREPGRRRLLSEAKPGQEVKS